MSLNTIEVTVVNKVQEAQDIASFELARVDGASLPPFSAGSHIDVQVNGDIVRQYSLCNDATEHHRYLIGVLGHSEAAGQARSGAGHGGDAGGQPLPGHPGAGGRADLRDPRHA